MAFPTLYPTGSADFHGIRTHQVTIGNYFSILHTFLSTMMGASQGILVLDSLP